MGWKNWPSWLKGGIILDGIFIVITLILLLIQPTGHNWNFPIWLDIVFFPTIYLVSYFINTSNAFLTILDCIILDLIMYFIFGAAIGFLIGKFWKKK
jgi:hypothetical protein